VKDGKKKKSKKSPGSEGGSERRDR
jgi:hypothetical protein